jgi:VIT1/CCC1 family predicted Fe2+/Mn2+ transporter
MTDLRRPSAEEVRRWRGYLADERAEAAIYRDLASRRRGPDRDILLELADAERRHERHWLDLLGPEGDRPTRVGLRTRLLGFLARRFGTVFVLALLQRAEGRSPYEAERDATPQMAADERIHEEVVRSLAMRGRNAISGTFRAAVFGANDGLVSNLALVLGVGAAGAAPTTVLFTGIAGLLAGALSMGAGEYVSVSSQRELLAASTPSAASHGALHRIDLDANEVALVFRARGLSQAEAETEAAALLADLGTARLPNDEVDVEAVGTPFRVALSSFAFFASGAVVPIVPWLLGMHGLGAVLLAAALVGLALLGSGAVVGLLSGASMWLRALRQLAIGYGAAAVTYLLGLAFGAVTG